MTLLHVERLDVRHGLLRAVRDLEFSVEPGEIVALVGANGAGKTTLLRALAGAHLPHAGRILLAGHDVTRLQAHRRVAEGVALVPEGRRLFADMSVTENLRLARAARRVGIWDVAAVLDVFPNLVGRLGARAGTLSGGEQQAVAIGRALLTNPRLLLLDEVSLGLSPAAVDRVHAALATLAVSGVTMILVEQDLSRALRIAGRVICMLEGRIALQGETAALERAAITRAYFGLPAAAVAA
jgi:branched-chain amino acid transport system ATP-binding protein